MALLGSSQACSGQENCAANNESKDYCYSARIRSTVLQGLPFGGVPTVLALDFMCFLVSRPWQRRNQFFFNSEQKIHKRYLQVLDVENPKLVCAPDSELRLKDRTVLVSASKHCLC
ncbi:hypothetical protein XENORESO_018885 [Xenotaenia resolanae]|uniref:Uncharacterized protein n=1 Tax=Xenotaenia resolanae TaxID=208358 RepID=A0ABV0X995_9TELE